VGTRYTCLMVRGTTGGQSADRATVTRGIWVGRVRVVSRSRYVRRMIEARRTVARVQRLSSRTAVRFRAPASADPHPQGSGLAHRSSRGPPAFDPPAAETRRTTPHRRKVALAAFASTGADASRLDVPLLAIIGKSSRRQLASLLRPRQDGSGFENVFSNPGTVTGCSVHYRSPATGAEVRPAIPTTAGCTLLTRGNGTIAPVPKTQ